MRARRAISGLAARLALGFVLVLSGAFAALPAGADEAGRALVVRLSPRAVAGRLEDVAVALTMTRPDTAAGEVLLEMPLVQAMAPSALPDSAAMTAWDEAGAVPLTIDEDAADPSGFRQDRRWRAGRATHGDVQVRYVATPRPVTAQTRPGPLYDMRAEGAGFHASGAILLALPPDASGWPRPVTIDWDLSAMPSGARAASSLGEGGVTVSADRGALARSFFMAGPLSSLPADGKGAFVGYWITPPAFDLVSALGKIEAAYGVFSRFFGDEAAPFRVFMRTTERFAGGGSGGHASFMFGAVRGAPREEAELLSLLAHETLHNWLNGLDGPTSQWWSEGTTTYYTEVLSYRAGLTTLDQYLQGMNALARAYALNPRSGLSSEEVARLFFSDGDAQLVPYQRGPLYFAQFDARMRAASQGRRRVDDLVLALLEARRSGGDYSTGGWVRLLDQALGQAGVEDFHAMMAGRALDLPEDLLGPCFRREATTYRRFDPGFRVEHDGLVVRMGEGSAGALAGVREGDRLVDPLALKTMEAADGGPAALDLVRDGRRLTVVLEPWGAERPGYRWVRNAAPEAACAI